MSAASVNTSLEVISAPPHWGRPSTRTPEVTTEICDRLAMGEPLAKICRDESMPSYTTVRRWIDEDQNFRANSARAKLNGTHYLAEETQMISDEPLHYDPETARVQLMQRKLQIDTRLRLIGKWNSKAYGDKVQIETKEAAKELGDGDLDGGLGFLAQALIGKEAK